MPFRAFIAIELKDTTSLEELHRDLSNVGSGLKPVDLGSVHVTLKFLGDVDEALVPKIEDAMVRSVIGTAPFQFRLRGVGAFPPRGPSKVIWVGMEGAEQMGVIASSLEHFLEPIGFVREDRPFLPHLTLARVKFPSAGFAAQQLAERHRSDDFGTRVASSIKLKKSVLTRYGPEYSTVLDVPFH
jgi:2'-5' RNA ligase